MATRVTLPSFSLPDARTAAGRLAAWRPAMPADRRAAAWRVATAPWWFWSEMPALPMPSRNPALPPGGLAGDWVVKGIDRIATRVWIQRSMGILARGLWLTALIGCLWLVIELLGGPALDLRVLVGAGIVLLLCSLVVAALSRPSRAHTARMLDRSFGLHERISTALGNIGLDLPVEDQRPAVTYLQMADAANAITIAQEHTAFRLRLPVRELVMAVALGLAFAALAFARGAGDGVPAVQTNVVPEFIPAAQRFVQPKPEAPPPNAQNVPSVADVKKMVQSSIDNQQDLSTLADALSDHAITRDAAQMIEQGKYSDAAEALRDVSSRADQLSDSERQDLASDLSQAASQMSEGNKTLSGSTQQAAEGLQKGGDEAQEGVRDLANAVEQSGQQVQSSEQLDQAMQQARQNEATNPPAEAAEGNQGQQSPNKESTGDQASDSSGQSAGQPGAADSTEGAEAEAGMGQDAEQSGSQPGEGAPASSDAASAAGQQDGQGSSDQSQPGEASGSSSQQANQSDSGESASANQGSSGAGGQSGDQDQQHATGENGPAGEAATDSASKKDPSKSNVTDSSQTGDDASGPKPDAHAAVTLNRAPQGESVQTSSDSGSSQVGAGAGVTVSSGSTTQGDVGQSGPDSNHVPPEYRSIVEGYFSDKDNGG